MEDDMGEVFEQYAARLEAERIAKVRQKEAKRQEGITKGTITHPRDRENADAIRQKNTFAARERRHTDEEFHQKTNAASLSCYYAHQDEYKEKARIRGKGYKRNEQQKADATARAKKYRDADPEKFRAREREARANNLDHHLEMERKKRERRRVKRAEAKMAEHPPLSG